MNSELYERLLNRCVEMQACYDDMNEWLDEARESLSYDLKCLYRIRAMARDMAAKCEAMKMKADVVIEAAYD